MVRRVLAVSPDPELARAIAEALGVLGEVVTAFDLATTTPEDSYALWVVHVDRPPDDVARDRLARARCPVIAVLPRANLAGLVELMLLFQPIAGIVVVDDLARGQLATLAARVIADEPAGLAGVVAPGTQVHHAEIGDYGDKLRCLAEVAAFVHAAGAARAVEAIEQCLDEMVMNALYDAPVGADGKRVFSGVPTRERVRMRTAQTVTVDWACDGTRIAIAVRDRFGSLDRQTVLRYLDKCLHADQRIDRKAGGAGVGLYLMVSEASAVYFHAIPGVATEAICVFDLVPAARQLSQLALVVELDADGRATTPPARALLGAEARRARRRKLVAVVAGVAVAVAGVVAWPYVFPPPEPPRLVFKTIPAGAAVELDGRPLGVATDGTLATDQVEVGHRYHVVARLPHHESAQAIAEAVAGTTEVTLQLRAIATVELASRPPGASVEIDGVPSGSTPVTLTTLTPGAKVTVELALRGYRPATLELVVAPAGEDRRVVQPLERSEDFVRVHFVSEPPGAEIVRDGQRADAIDRTFTPADVFVEAGTPQRFMLVMPGYLPMVIEPFTPARGATVEKGGALAPGVALRIEGAAGGRATVRGTPHCVDLAVPFECTVTPGEYVVELAGAKPRTVKVGDGGATVKF